MNLNLQFTGGFMNIIVFLKMVPDVVEELKIAGDKKSLDEEWLRMKLNESDDHALEEAIILKEKYGAKVDVVAIDAPELNDVLYTALAKGADRSIKIICESKKMNAELAARVYSTYLKNSGLQIDSQTIILTGSQAIDDLEGEMVYYLAENLGLNSAGVITNISIDKDKALLTKEFSSGLRGEYEISLPAVIGIQAAEKPSRYVPIAKVRAIMKSTKIDEVEIPAEDMPSKINLLDYFKPEVSGKAKMFEGDPEKISAQIADLFVERGII
jgi:electron transfer flavoprotein beta subunit